MGEWENMGDVHESGYSALLIRVYVLNVVSCPR